ncbi:MAG TPA: AAA family ATPase [Terriglobales bacterium]|nr:AAA family ATPase [Terriglobales bacterium]
MKLTPDHYRTYFERRLGRSLRGVSSSVKCVFHDDGRASLSIDTEKGVFKCHAGCGEGGVRDFEQKYSNCDADTAWANISEVLGVPQLHLHKQEPEAVYAYHDGLGRLVFQKLRFPGKRFSQRRPDGKGGWIHDLKGIERSLYNLPEILTATQIFICEGEKDCDNLKAVLPGDGKIAVTTNFDGAHGTWKESDSFYFAGKRVVILPDDDAAGRKHAAEVAASVARYALGVKVLELSGLPEKGDVSDYLQLHTIEDLLTELKACPVWRPAEPEKKLLVPAPAFAADVPDQVNWMVNDVIERGANGFIVANPKIGKSWAAVDLAVSLALGCPWLEFAIPRPVLEFAIPRPVKVALISREDNPGLTAWRLRHLFNGKAEVAQKADVGLWPERLASNLYINSRRQSPQLMLDNAEQMAELTAALKRLGTEFAIFDVFNILHAADENDATDMRLVMQRLTQLQVDVGCSVGVIHHFSKGTDGMSLTQRLRGSSAISGWCEWLVGLSMAEPNLKIRKMEFEIKAAESPEPAYLSIASESGWTRLQRSNWRPATEGKANGSAARYMQ